MIATLTYEDANSFVNTRSIETTSMREADHFFEWFLGSVGGTFLQLTFTDKIRVNA